MIHPKFIIIKVLCLEIVEDISLKAPSSFMDNYFGLLMREPRGCAPFCWNAVGDISIVRIKTSISLTQIKGRSNT